MESPAKRMVAVCDILGFRSLVLRRDLASLIENELSFFRRLVGFSIEHGEVPEIPPSLVELRQRDRIGLAWFSDTVIIYAKSDEDMACRDVLEAVGWLVFTSMFSSTRIRAGIAYGQFYADPDNEIHVGSALVEAHELEQAQQWAGAALAKSAAERLPDRTTAGARFQWWVCEYPAPLKPNSEVEFGGLVIDWTQPIHDHFDFRWSKDMDEPTTTEIQRNVSVYEKWKNIRKFHREVCTSCFPENRGRDPLKVL